MLCTESEAPRQHLQQNVVGFLPHTQGRRSLQRSGGVASSVDKRRITPSKKSADCREVVANVVRSCKIGQRNTGVCVLDIQSVICSFARFVGRDRSKNEVMTNKTVLCLRKGLFKALVAKVCFYAMSNFSDGIN